MFSYGKPEEGSKTAERGKKAGQLVEDEINLLCRIIKQHGTVQESGNICITFRELFEMYKVISNKVVGILLRGRKHGFLHFDGEMLYQGRNDQTVITLMKEHADEVP